MIRSVIAAALIVLLSACSSSHTVPACRGSFAAANPGKWQPTPADLRR